MRAIHALVFAGFVFISGPSPAVQPWLWWAWVAVTGLYLTAQLATALALRR